MFGALTPLPAAAPPGRGPARRPRPDRDLHALAAARRPEPDAFACPSRSRPSSPSCARACCRAWSRRPRRNVELGAERRRAVRDRARLPARRRGCPTRRRTSPGSSRAAGRAAKGIVEALYAALKAEPSFERAEHELLHPGKSAATRGRRRRRAAPGRARGRLGRVRARPGEAARGGARGGASTRTSSGSRRCSRISRSSSPRTCAAGELVAAAREAAGAELREMRPFDVYRGEQVGAGRKSIAFAVDLPVGRADADRRGRGQAAPADRRGAARALRRRATSLEPA